MPASNYDIVPAMPEDQYMVETPNGVQFKPNTPFEVWERYLHKLAQDYNALRWRVGDALAFGETRYGEMYAQAVGMDGINGLSVSSLQKCVWVSRAIPPEDRQPMPWSYHAVIAPLAQVDRDLMRRMLTLAAAQFEMGTITRATLEAQVRMLLGKDAPPERLVLTSGDPESIAEQLIDRLGPDTAREVGYLLIEGDA